MSAGQIDVERKEGLVHITLNNPSKLNAMTWDMWVNFADTWLELNDDDSVRCIVLEGAGDRAFCPGNDIGEFATYRSNATQARHLSENMNRGREAMLSCPHPIIAKIQGACVGGGLEIAAMCDMRICSNDSRFGAPLNRIGLTMAYEEMLPIWRITDQATLFEFLVEGRIVDAVEAKARGIVNRVVDQASLSEHVNETAQRIVDGPPLVNRWHKKFFKRLNDSRALTKEDYEEHYLAFETEDYKIGYTSFLEKKTPTFVGK
ncbi:MAG: enoyl-CoA hydratase/isomerase family protein [Pseudomonadota bacterium]